MLIVTTRIIYGVTAIGCLYKITHLFLDMHLLQKELILRTPRVMKFLKERIMHLIVSMNRP